MYVVTRTKKTIFIFLRWCNVLNGAYGKYTDDSLFFFKLRAFLLFIGSSNLGSRTDPDSEELIHHSSHTSVWPKKKNFTYECRVTTLHLYIAERNHHRRWFTVQQFLPFSFPLSNSFFPFYHSLLFFWCHKGVYHSLLTHTHTQTFLTGSCFVFPPKHRFRYLYS